MRYTNDDQLYDLLWLANRRKYFLLATSTTSWFSPAAPGTLSATVLIVLLAAKAGLRAGEIANLTWDMVLDPTGDIGSVIELRDHVAKNGSGRLIPVHSELRQALAAYCSLSTGSGPVIRSERGGAMRP